MNVEKQRSVIAEAFPKVIGLSSSGAWMWSNKPGVWQCCFPDNCPLSDHNAMHEVVRSFGLGQLKEFSKYLRSRLVASRTDTCSDSEVWASCLQATPYEFAEAIVKSVGKWEEEL